MLTQQILKQLFQYNPDTGIFIRLVSRGNAKAGAEAGSKGGHGYLQIRIDRKRYLAHRLAWLYMTGEFPKDQIDHINHVRVDNRLVNLRGATRQENGRNRSMQSNNTSGITGMSWDKHAGKWLAQIRVEGKQIYLGLYEDINAAILARQCGELLYEFHKNHGAERLNEVRE